MNKVKIFSISICLIFFILSVQSDADPLLLKDYQQGPVILLDQDKFVDYVAIYVLIDKSHLKSKKIMMDHYVVQLEKKLSEQGAICQTFWNSNLPELPYNYQQQNFLVAYFAADEFEKKLPDILKAIFQPSLKERLLYYDKNVLIQRNEASGNIDSLMNQDQKNGFWDAVTLRKHLYLFFRGKINTFQILKSINAILNTKTNLIEQPEKRTNSRLRYWMVVIQKFILEQLKQNGSVKKSDCLRIFAPIDFEKNKILIEADFKLKIDSLFKERDVKTLFKEWYLTNYLQSFEWLNLNKDQQALLHLYSSCYIPDFSLFEIDLEVDEQQIEAILNHLNDFVEYYDEK